MDAHAAKIVLYGMSCVGKTTFARRLASHRYCCFDALFDWHGIETMGLSPAANLRSLVVGLGDGPWVLDGWHLSDRDCSLIPDDVTIYVLFADYARIIGQYRIPVDDPDEFRGMYARWYDGLAFRPARTVRYFENCGEFTERSAVAYRDVVGRSR